MCVSDRQRNSLKKIVRDMREGECIHVWRSVKKEGEVEKRTSDMEQEREQDRVRYKQNNMSDR